MDGLTPRGRVACAALLTFAAGSLLGFATGRGTAPEPGSGLEPALAAWAAATDEALQLRPGQSEDLRILLAHYARERDRMLKERLAEADNAWLGLDRRFETLLRSRILDADQRSRADALLIGGILVGPPSQR
ncbi:MAG: hypothetical protein O3A20_05885 [Planctomycetota bacterium]|nr:hypothetical protein [Planctomycetota bacterium]